MVLHVAYVPKMSHVMVVILVTVWMIVHVKISVALLKRSLLIAMIASKIAGEDCWPKSSHMPLLNL